MKAARRNRLREGAVVPVLAPLWLGSEHPGVAEGPAALDRAMRAHLALWEGDGPGPRIAPAIRLDARGETPAAVRDPRLKHLDSIAAFCRTLADRVEETVRGDA